MNAELWKEKELNWAEDVKYLCELRKVKFSELSRESGYEYRLLLRMLKNGMSNHQRDELIKVVNWIADGKE